MDVQTLPAGRFHIRFQIQFIEKSLHLERRFPHGFPAEAFIGIRRRQYIISEATPPPIVKPAQRRVAAFGEEGKVEVWYDTR